MTRVYENSKTVLTKGLIDITKLLHLLKGAAMVAW